MRLFLLSLQLFVFFTCVSQKPSVSEDNSKAKNKKDINPKQKKHLKEVAGQVEKTKDSVKTESKDTKQKPPIPKGDAEAKKDSNSEQSLKKDPPVPKTIKEGVNTGLGSGNSETENKQIKPSRILPFKWEECAPKKVIFNGDYEVVKKTKRNIDALERTRKYIVTECQLIDLIQVVRTYTVTETRTYGAGSEEIIEDKTYNNFRYDYIKPKSAKLIGMLEPFGDDEIILPTQENIPILIPISRTRCFDTTKLTRDILKKMYKKNEDDNSHLFISANFIPSITYRALFVNSGTNYTTDALQKRHLSERSDYRLSYSISAGYSYKKKHSVYLEFLWLQQGFLSRYNEVDWNTGFADKSAKAVQHYKFNYRCLGLGYAYKGSSRAVNPLVDLGLLYSIYQYANYSNNTLSVSGKDLTSNESTKNLISNQLTAKLGVGAAFTAARCLEFRLAPTFYYNLSPASSQYIATRLFNVGLNGSIVFYIGI